MIVQHATLVFHSKSNSVTGSMYRTWLLFLIPVSSVESWNYKLAEQDKNSLSRCRYLCCCLWSNIIIYYYMMQMTYTIAKMAETPEGRFGFFILQL